MRITLILKGNITRRSHFEKSLESLRNALPTAAIPLLETRREGQAVELARRACHDSDYLLIAGGDGTINEVLNGCLRAQQHEPQLQLPTLGILAYGSANDLCRSLGLRGDVAECVQLLRNRSSALIDAGIIRFQTPEGEDAERFFLNAAGLGLGARSVQHLGRRPRLLGSNLHYLRSILTTLATYRPQPIRVRSDRGMHWEGDCLALAAANGRFVGSGLCIAPGARLDDGQLAITLVGEADSADLLRNLGHLRRGELLNHPAAHYDHAAQIEVEHLAAPVPVEADGEFLGQTPVSISIIPSAISILHPGLGA
ncbi:diacylglycerol/lipid kinase family protein [Haliea sp. E17]|uniref:diacylglycerol/lipid kinase family protein n=1 Tax=Haliea sp. E17 TaxID=3401576 RepID=UPI003AAABEA1